MSDSESSTNFSDNYIGDSPPSSPIGPIIDWEDVIHNAKPDVTEDDISTVAFSDANSGDSAYQVSSKKVNWYNPY